MIVAAVWGVFRVPNDGGAPVVTVPGPVRLLIEAVVFIGAILALAAANQPTTALILAVVVGIDYIGLRERVVRLARNLPLG